MKTLGKGSELKSSDQKKFTIPVVIRENNKEIELKKATVISTISHFVVPFTIWLIIIILSFFGITLLLFHKPEAKVRDIEFVLVNKKEESPINKHTKFRSDKNNRAGGKHDPKKAVSQPEPMSAKSAPSRESAPAQPAPKSMPQRPKQRAVQKTAPSAAKPKATPSPPRPTPRRSIPKPSFSPPRAFNIPVPRAAKAPRSLAYSGGPATSSPSGVESSSSSPSPVVSGGAGSPSRSSRHSGYSRGGGNAGNPGPGNPNGRPGIDTIKEPDFGSYMSEVQRRIKRNWQPPRGNESKRVVLIFKIGKSGRLLSTRVLKSSGLKAADSAAISAVELSAPFRPLPPEYRGDDIDIQFTFDYNVFGVKSYN